MSDRMTSAEYARLSGAAPATSTRFRARPRSAPGTMNKTEARYAAHLEAEQRAGRVEAFHFEALTFKLGPDCRFTPDFCVLRPDGSMEFHEVKGFWRDDAKVKIRVAAQQWPCFAWLAVRLVQGAWDVEWFG